MSRDLRWNTFLYETEKLEQGETYFSMPKIEHDSLQIFRCQLGSTITSRRFEGQAPPRSFIYSARLHMEIYINILTAKHDEE